MKKSELVSKHLHHLKQKKCFDFGYSKNPITVWRLTGLKASGAVLNLLLFGISINRATDDEPGS